MSVTVSANKLSVVHAGSAGTTVVFPDVCKTPTPGGPVPIPYPNIARSADSASGAKKVKADGQPLCIKDSNFSTSTGDEAGTAGGGLASSKTKGKAEFVNFSFDVKAEGKNVPRAFDMMLHNDKNTPPSPLLQGPAVAVPPPTPTCYMCGKPF